MKSQFYKNIEEVIYYDFEDAIYLITEDLDFKDLKEGSVGAIVPYIIAQESLQESGVLKISFEKEEAAQTVIIPMDDVPQKPFEKGLTLLMFVDPLTPLFEPFIAALDDELQDNMLYGSGVGSRSFASMPIIFSEGKISAEHALIVAFKSYVRVGLKHGWEPMHGPLVVTKTKGTELLEFNYDDAFEVYADVIYKATGEELTTDNFFDLAKGFPLGILSYAYDEFIIRDPLGRTEEGGLALLNSIDEHETVYIMRGEPQELIASAAKNAKEVAALSHESTYLLFDCISRVLYMEDEFNTEVKEIEMAAKDSTLNGICSTGEITNVGFSKLIIFNKTNLLGAFYAADNY